MEKLIVTAALTGNFHTKKDNPNLPEQPDEIIQQACECWRAGASTVHIHARDSAGRPTADVDVFTEIVEGIRGKCDVVINVSTGGAATIPFKQRYALVPALKPEIASFSVGSGMTGRYDFKAKKWIRDFALIQSYEGLEFIARTMLENGTKPELEVYDLAMINNVLLLKEMGLLEEPLLTNLVFGIPGQCMQATPKNLLHLVESLPTGSNWQATGVGKHSFSMGSMAIVLGGHVRVGMEDSVYISKGVLAKSNVQFVEKIIRMANDIGREVATPNEARKILALPSRKK